MKILFVFLLASTLGAEVFESARMDGVYRMRLDKGALVLESILEFLQKNGIEDAAVLTAAGSVEECTVHGVNSKMRRFTEPMEFDSLNGIVAAGEPHLHAVLSNDKGAVGGHLEKNCKVLSHLEVTVVKLSGQKLARVHSELKKKE
jgi:predicted DNA-binding protein with PD1-like motif